MVLNRDGKVYISLSTIYSRFYNFSSRVHRQQQAGIRILETEKNATTFSCPITFSTNPSVRHVKSG